MTSNAEEFISSNNRTDKLHVHPLVMYGDKSKLCLLRCNLASQRKKQGEMITPGGIVDFDHVIQVIDAEIERLQEARAVLAGTGSKRGPGRPKVTTHKAGASHVAQPGTRKRRLSAEGRKRIADAMRKRWAERKKAQGSSKQQGAK